MKYIHRRLPWQRGIYVIYIRSFFINGTYIHIHELELNLVNEGTVYTVGNHLSEHIRTRSRGCWNKCNFDNLKLKQSTIQLM